MKDIKSLYITARNTRSEKDITSYNECINDLINSPTDYLSNLEYIISSNIGLSTLNTFIETHGIPLFGYDIILENLEKCIHRAFQKGMNDSIYVEKVKEIEAFKKDHIYCFAMFESFSHDIDSKYIESYYKFFPMFKEHVGKDIDFTKLINVFGESVIPDILLYNEKFGDINNILNILESKEEFNSPILYQWISEAVKDIKTINDEMAIKIKNKSLGSIVESVQERNKSIFVESTLAMDNNAVYTYTEDELYAIENLITFKEYMLTYLENADDMITLQKEIYALYEEFDGIIEDGETIVDMLAQPINEDKKLGTIPSFLKNHHDMGYGEDDGKSLSPEDDIDSFRRPEKPKVKKTSDDIPEGDSVDDLTTSDNVLNTSDDEKNNSNIDTKTSTSDDKKSAGNVYYNYYYQNKYDGSFNKHHTSHDDHSSNKRVNSDDNNYKTESNLFELSIKDSQIQEKEISDRNKTLKFAEGLSNFLGFDVLKINDKFLNEAAGDADADMPVSDNPIKDTLLDIDRALTKSQQNLKKTFQSGVNVGRAFSKPFVRTTQWINNTIQQWKDADENDIKERLADPRSRSSLWKAIKSAIVGGSLFKAGLLLNPIFLFLTLTRAIGKGDREFRIRNEIIGELKTELEIIDVKIQDADRANDNAAKYKLMRFKNELHKKLLRVGGGKRMAKMI